MNQRRASRRSGITLTEILIAIMIMGIGFVSVATLFPIGLMRMRDATRASRSALLAITAANEANARNLLNGPSFLAPGSSWYAVRYGGLPPHGPFNPSYLPTPWNKDYHFDAASNSDDEAAAPGVWAHVPGFPALPNVPGLPVAYDPLFWSAVHFNTFDPDAPATAVTPLNTRNDRFGSGIGFIRPDADGNPPAAHGLQRITNFRPYDPTLAVYASSTFWPFTYSVPSTPPALANQVEVAGDVFTSIDDPVFEDSDSGDRAGSPLVPVDFNPDPLVYEPQRVWDFTWMITARQAAAGDSSVYEADVVLFHKRPIGFDLVAAPIGGGQRVVPSGERTIEAVWGHTNSAGALDANGYSTADDRAVLLRWPTASPDPIVRVGDWIADVTYERVEVLSGLHFQGNFRGQRCHWYRIAQVSQVEADPTFPGHRRRLVRIDTPMKAKTRQVFNGTDVVPPTPEAALINPYVVNVYSTLLYSRQ